MGLDIRIPIGLLFSVIGILMTIYGFFTNSDVAMYQKSLGINVNIWLGLIMLVFGAVMLFFARKKKKPEAK